MSGPAEHDSAKGEVTPQEVERLFERLNEEAESGGYHLNPDRRFTLGLIEGMLVNERRYGYWACPCRLASGVKKEDLDIICPCDYRDADVAEYGACYCGLYVSQDVVDGRRKVARVPERRPAEDARMQAAAADPAQRMSETSAAGPSRGQEPAGPSPALPDLAAIFKYPLWRCRVCGYLCSRGQAPEVCPICRAKKDRFERLV
ncbi:MAG TPA: ferredoxin-thioredoxin reductase catalytic domain-containing protein [Spirochaetia bacterium]|nr:ferredoxin-thioredoxin reductase catalytic domain-containing protein [Spirochaetia bacterium]